ncbi:hypothetical protein Sjap_006442 [Stephania japonica]|uniref:Uncharacterized protein n=1 Tax=Stephania japonica TaxID=461633 RepID=A0AAP0K7I9_9MAGN
MVLVEAKKTTSSGLGSSTFRENSSIMNMISDGEPLVCGNRSVATLNGDDILGVACLSPSLVFSSL